MPEQYKLVGSGNRHTDWTTRVVLERNEDGSEKKVIGATEPAELNKDDRDALEEQGFSVEKVSKDEAEELSASSAVGADAASAGPVFGDSPGVYDEQP